MKARSRVPEDTAVIDARTCEAWLARATLADPKQACQELTALLESLEEAPPPDADYLDVLERLREPIAITLAEHAKKITGRPVPLRDFEASVFDQLQDLWSAFGGAYSRLLARAGADPGAVLSLMPLLAQRALDCSAELMAAHYRCRREVDFELWRELHRLYRAADDGHYALEKVPCQPALQEHLELPRGVRPRAAAAAVQPLRPRRARTRVDAALGHDVGVQGRPRHGGRRRAGLRRGPGRRPAAALDQGRACRPDDALSRDLAAAPQREGPRAQARDRRRPADARARQGLRAARGRAPDEHAGALLAGSAVRASVHAPRERRRRRTGERSGHHPHRAHRPIVQGRVAALGLFAPRRRDAADLRHHLGGRRRRAAGGADRAVGIARRERQRLPPAARERRRAPRAPAAGRAEAAGCAHVHPVAKSAG